jgi:hypothetical protein
MKATYVEIEPEQGTECSVAGKCLEEEAIGHETNICSDGCVQGYRPTIKRAIFKDPITDDGTKKSAKGLLLVYKDKQTGDYALMDDVCSDSEGEGELKLIFQDSTLLEETSLEEIRSRLKG